MSESMETSDVDAFSESSFDEEEMNDVNNPDIMNKYKAAADVTNAVSAWIQEQLVNGVNVKISQLCSEADHLIVKKVIYIL
jgi:methionine aminopeptidase